MKDVSSSVPPRVKVVDSDAPGVGGLEERSAGAASMGISALAEAMRPVKADLGLGAMSAWW